MAMATDPSPRSSPYIKASKVMRESRGLSSALSLSTEPLFRAEDISCLVVEDNKINQRVAQSFLRRLGLREIDVAGNGEEALVRARERHYDIILMDIMMPIMDGLESTKCIRAESGPNQNTVIVAVSAMGVANLPLAETGITDFLSKPFTKNELQDIMRKWVTPSESLTLDKPISPIVASDAVESGTSSPEPSSSTDSANTVIATSPSTPLATA